MANRETHETDEFVAVDDDGTEYMIIEYQEVIEQRAIDKPLEWIKAGPRWYRLRDGTPVNYIDGNTFKISTTDKVLTRVR
jgi:hypothetical protein